MNNFPPSTTYNGDSAAEPYEKLPVRIKILGEALNVWITRPIDGDTVEVLLPLAWGVWVEKSVRIAGIESWELDSDHRADARRVRATMETFLRMVPAVLVPVRSGTEAHGRIVATLTVGGRDLATILCQKGLAWPTTRPKWKKFAPRCPPRHN